MNENRAVLSPYGIFCLGIAAYGGLLFGYHTAIISGALLFLSHAFQLSVYDEGVVVSSLLLGALPGALLAGIGADRFGRKYMLLFTALLCFAGATVIFSAVDYFQLLTGRLLTGFAIGITSVITPLYLAEIAPPHYRGRCVCIFQLAIAIGIILAYAASFFFAEKEEWKPLFFIGGLFALMQFFALLFVPETPSWAIAHKMKARAIKALKVLRKDLLWQEEFHQEKDVKSQGWKLLTRFFYVLFIGVFLSIFQQITGINAVIYYTPKIFQEVGISTTFTVFLATLGVGAVNLLATIFSSWTLDKVGRRPLLLSGAFGMFLSLCILSYAFFTKSDGAGSMLTFVSLIAYVASFSLSLGPVTWVVLSEIYPLSIRGKAIAIAVAWNWFSNYVVALYFPEILQRWGGGGTFGLFAAVSLIAFFFIYRCIPETKGKTLEEIETIVKSGKF